MYSIASPYGYFDENLGKPGQTLMIFTPTTQPHYKPIGVDQQKQKQKQKQNQQQWQQCHGLCACRQLESIILSAPPVESMMLSAPSLKP
jgi:hypothetical protein